jgi:hypothetical protein
MWLRSRGIQDYSHEQTQRPTRKRCDRDMPEALHVDMRENDVREPNSMKKMVLPPARDRVRVQCVERCQASSFKLREFRSGLHGEPPVLREQQHDARDGVYGAGEKLARVWVRGEPQAALLQLAHLVPCAVDLAIET